MAQITCRLLNLKNKSNEKYDGWKFYEHEFLLTSINSDENKTLDDLITKVKNYQP